jgi:hypothetical protein
VFLYAAEKRRLSEWHHRAENCPLTLCKVLDISRTLSNKLTFDDVSPSTFDVSSALDDVRVEFEDVSPLTFDMSSSFDDLSWALDDRSAEMSLACPLIIPNNS